MTILKKNANQIVLKDCRLTVNPCDSDKLVEMEFIDGVSSSTIFTCRISPINLMEAFGRLYGVECKEAVLSNMDIAGKKMEISTLSFEMPDNVPWKERKKTAVKLAYENCPEGWVPDTSFSSQGSFQHKDGKEYAHTVIRRWVEVTE